MAPPPKNKKKKAKPPQFAKNIAAPVGGSPSNPGDNRPRAQAAYEGDDEFSAMSLDPERRKREAHAVKLAPLAPGQRDKIEVTDLKARNQPRGFVKLIRKLFS